MKLYKIQWYCYSNNDDELIGRMYYIWAEDIAVATKPAMRRFKQEDLYPFEMKAINLTDDPPGVDIIISPSDDVFDGLPGINNIEYIFTHEPSPEYLAGILSDKDIKWANDLVDDNDNELLIDEEDIRDIEWGY